MRRRLLNPGVVVHETSVWGASVCLFHATHRSVDARTVGDSGEKLVEAEGWRWRCPEDSQISHKWLISPDHDPQSSLLNFSSYSCTLMLTATKLHHLLIYLFIMSLHAKLPGAHWNSRIGFLMSALPDLSPPQAILANSCQVTKNHLQQQEHPKYIFS